MSELGEAFDLELKLAQPIGFTSGLETLIKAHRAEFIGACLDLGLNRDAAQKCLVDFEWETISGG